MMPSGRSSRHPGRALFASVALVANLIAAGVPLLHAWAHEAHAAARSPHLPARAAHHGPSPTAPAASGHDDRHHDSSHVPGPAHEHASLVPADAGHDEDHHGAANPPAPPPEHERSRLVPAAARDDDHHHGAANPPAPPPEHEHSPPVPAAAGDDDHHHDAAHPPALHEDCLLVHRAALSLVLPPPAAELELPGFMADDTPTVHPVLPVPSRAPPSADRTRAPPLA
ncbi:MAG TPA: hypothetical protein VFZ18_02530 [Longimicrobiaceae bacterium]